MKVGQHQYHMKLSECELAAPEILSPGDPKCLELRKSYLTCRECLWNKVKGSSHAA